jgi:hypothetical protein
MTVVQMGPPSAALMSLCMMVAGVRAELPSVAASAERRVPIVYSSDLLHPHDDPDDHFDLATLFSLPEFDIRAIVLDQGDRQVDRPGEVPVRQMMHLSGRAAPYAIGLARKLRSPEDKATDQPAPFQGGVALIFKALRESARPVTVFQTGSLRDIAAAFNREPALFREKVARLYVNTGHAGGQREWNVDLDPHAYVCIMRSGLPVYWVPCFGPDGYSSLWKFRHDRVLESAPPRLQNFFVYALAKVPPSRLDPIAALTKGLEPSARAAMWTQERNMWCTAAFLHAAGREIVRQPDGRWELVTLAANTPQRVAGRDLGGATATAPSPSSRIVGFERRRIRLGADGKTVFDDDGKEDEGNLRVLVFRRGEERAYNEAMTTALRILFKNPGR